MLATLLLASLLVKAAETCGFEPDLYFPEALQKEADVSDLTSDELRRQSLGRCMALNGRGGQPYGVAVFSNGLSGRVAVFRKDAHGWSEIANAEVPADYAPILKGDDLDADGRPEIIGGAHDSRSHEMVAVFRWNGSELIDLSPKDEEDAGPFGGFVDVDGDGRKEMLFSLDCETALRVARADNTATACASAFWSLTAAGFERTGVLAAFEVFRREREPASVVTRTFEVTVREGQRYSLTVFPYDREGGSVGPAAVSLNGQALVRRDDFPLSAGRRRIFAVPVLDGLNRLQVELEGEEGTGLVVSVSDP